MVGVRGEPEEYVQPEHALVRDGKWEAGPGFANPAFTLPVEGVKLDELENELVRQAMDRAQGNKSRAAKILGISRDQIRYRLEKMGEA